MKTRLLNTVNWRRYLDENENPRAAVFLESRGYEVLKQIAGNINRAVSRNQNKLVIVVHPNVGNAIVIQRNEYAEFFELALNWFKKNEHYEMCHEIQKYQSNLEKPSIKKQRLTKTLS